MARLSQTTPALVLSAGTFPDGEWRRISYVQSSAALTKWKKTEELAFLSEVSCVPLQQALRHLQPAERVRPGLQAPGDRGRALRLGLHHGVELEQEEGELIEPGRSYPIWSPDRAFTAANALLQALQDEKGHE